MNFLKSTLIRISLAVLFLAAGLAPAASAQPLVTSTFRIFVDQDPSANVGCVATTTLGTVLTGIDQVVTITFQYTPAPTFTGVSRQACSGGTFGAPLFPAPPLAFGATAGVGGSTGIETSVPLPSAPTGNVRLYFDSIYTGSTAPGNRDELISLNGVPSGPPILVGGGGTAIPIPTLGEWGLILLALLLTASGFLVIRRRGGDRRWVVAGVLLLLLGLGAGVAWAAGLVVDGNTSDWNPGNSTRADDIQPPDAQPNSDIVAGFGGLQGSTLFLRLDVRFSATPVSNRPPVVNGATFSLPENSPNGTVVGTVTFSDPDAGQNHTFSIVGGNTGGAFAIDPSTGQITVANSAALDFETTPTFNLTVQVTDDGTPIQSGTGTVTINLTNVDDVNPTAVNDAATVAEDSAANPIDVLANDTDADGGAKSISAVTQPANGTVAITGGGTGLTYTPNANYCNSVSGPADTFTYTLTPGGSTATVSVTVTCSDDAPVAVADAATVAEDSGASPIPVLANDTDIDGGPKSVASVTQPANGTVAITGGGTGVTYTPNANYCNTPPGTTPDTFTYTLAPGGSTATVSVTVTCVDDAPVAVNDAATVAEDSVATPIPVLANDTDSDGGPISIASVTQPVHGTVVITGGGSGLTYQPNADYCNNPAGSPDTFTYTLTPGSSTATVSVTVTCADDNPVAVADAATVAEDSGANPIDVLANDTDVDGGPKSVASVTQPANGTVVITGGGTGVSYTPNANYCNGVSGPPDSFTYALAPGGSSTSVLVTVTCVDDPPAAVNDTATVTEDSGANPIDVLANDPDIDGGPKQIQSVTQPANGVVVITGGGTGLTYAPNPNYCNTPPGTFDTFTYMLAPGGSTATVSVTVTCVNDAPVLDLDADNNQGTTGSDFAVTFTEGTPAVLLEDPVDATVTDVDNTTLASLTVTITNVLDPGSETLSADVTGTSITAAYVPATGVLTLTGPDTVANFQTVLRKIKYQDTDVDPDTTPRVIHFVANDGTADSNTATSTVTIVAVDTQPTAVNDAATVAEDSSANPIDVLANDTDPDNGPKSVASVTQPANGTVAITGGGTGVTYTPNANYCNSVSGPADTFTYTLTPGGSSATVSVTVTCVDDNPVAVADAATVVEDSGPNAINVLANDTDPDGGPKSIASVTQPANGVVVITGGGTGLTYAPNANYCNSVSGPADTFTYTLTPGSSSATVTVTVTCVDDNPVAVADAATVVEDSSPNAINVLANDTDVDGGPKSIASVTQPAHGVVVITGGGTGLTYAPAADYCNSVSGPADTFTYTLAPGGSSTTVTVTVTCVDDPPVAVADAATVVEDSSANAINVLANDTDVDGGPKSVASVTQPANGTVAITGGGTGVTYTPNANYCNSVSGPADTFSYTLTPGSSSTTVSVTVTCVDDNPVAVADAATVVEDSGANAINVLANDTDVDGGPKSIASVTQPANGTVVITGGGTGLTYAPNANYCNSVSGPADTFTYTLSPGGSSTTVSVTVTCVDDNPVAVADAATVVEDSGANPIDVLANDTDVDGGPKGVASVTQPAHGTVAITGGGTGVTYTPSADYCNSVSGPADTFTYTLSPGGSSTTVSVTVTCVDDPPVAVNDSATVTEDDPATSIPVLANDTDIDGGPKSIASVTQPANGTVVITGGGTGLTYKPNANYCNNPPGTFDTFSYTLTPGGSSATVSVSVTCVNDAPVLTTNPVTYTTPGNTQLHVAGATRPGVAAFTDAQSVLTKANPSDIDGPGPLQVVAASGASANGGSFTITTDGSFSYVPPAGFTGTDSFTYMVTDNGSPAATTTGTVNITVGQRVWYIRDLVDTDNPAGGDGRSTNAFDSIAAFNAATTNNGDIIFIFRGNTGTTPLAGGIVLKDGQKLWGEGIGLNVPGFGQLVPAGSKPKINNTGGDAVSVPATAGNRQNVEVRGLDLQGSGNAVDVTASGANIVGVTISDNAVSGAGLEGFDLNAGSTGAFTATLDNNDIAATGNGFDARTSAATTLTLGFTNNVVVSNANGILIDGSGGGTTTIIGFANNGVSGNTVGTGISITNAKFDATPGGGYQTVSGGTTVVGASGNGVGASGVLLTNVSGDLAFTDLDIFAGGGAGLRVTGTGAVNVGAGTGTRITVGAGVAIFEAVGGPAVDVTNATIDLQPTSIKSTNSPTTGVALNSVGGTFAAGSGSSISNITSAAGTAFQVGSSNATINYAGTINTTTGKGVDLTSNTGSTIGFTGTLTLSTGTSTAFNATGGGTVTTTDTASTLTTTTGTALNVANTTIGASGLKFRSISAGTAASGPASGIVLNSTGALGGLTVSGTGSAGSGGTIQKTTGAGISLTSTSNVSLTNLNVQNGSTIGLLGSNVTGMTLSSVNITNNGTGAADDNLQIANLLGTVSFTNITVTGAQRNNVFIDNTSSTPLSSFTVTGSNFSNNSAANGNTLFLFQARLTSTVTTASISGSTFSNSKGTGLQVITADTATVSDFTVSGNTFSSNNNHMDFDPAGASSLTVKVLNNGTAAAPLTGSSSQAINFFTAPASTGGTFNVRVQGNYVGNAGTAASGSTLGNCIRVNINGNMHANVLLDGNTLRQCPNGRGIEVIGRDGIGSADVTVTNNDANPNDVSGFPLAAIFVQSNCVGPCNTVRTDVRGNTVPAGSATGEIVPTFIALAETSGAPSPPGTSTLQLVDTAPASANCTAQLTSTNTGSASANAGCSLIAGPITTPP